MNYYIFIKDGIIIGKGGVKAEADGLECIEVTEDVYNNSGRYTYLDGEIIAKSEEEYEAEQISEKKEQFNSEFFSTSLGYIRRKVTMSTGETKDFLSDLLPVISLGIQSGQEVTIITYNEPDFTQDLTTEYMESLQQSVTVTSDFIQECFVQLSNDFLG